MTHEEAMKLALDALEAHADIGIKSDKAIAALKEALAQEKALQALHDENERLGLYKDAYAEPVNFEKLADLGWQAVECTICGGGAIGYPQRTEQEQQIETLKRCLFQMQEAAKDLVEQAKSLPPPQRTWVGLTYDEFKQIMLATYNIDLNVPGHSSDDYLLWNAIEAKLKEKNT